MVKPGKRGRGGHSGGRGGHHNPPQATRSESADLISKQESCDSEGQSDASDYETISEGSKTKHEISIQASLNSKSSVEQRELSEGEISFNKKFRREPGYDFENSQNSHYMGPNYSAQSTRKSQHTNNSQCTSTPKSSRVTWSDESDEEGNGFTQDYLEVLENKKVRLALTKILIDPILDRVRELENNQSNAEKKIHKLEKRNAKLEENVGRLEEEIKTLRETKSVNKKSLEEEISHIKHKTNINQRMQDQDRRNNLVIVGIKESKNETTDEIDKKVNEILQNADIKLEGSFVASRLGKPIDEESPGFIARLKSGNKQKKQVTDLRPRPVKLCLTNQWDKHMIYKARIRMKDTKNAGIFINEDLP